MLYGRCEERALIAGLLAQARRGHGGVLVVRGEAGIGKHALLQDAAEQATGFQQLRCGGIEAEVELPFAGLQQLPVPKPRRCGGAFGLVDAGTDTNRFLVELGALSLVAVAAAEQPLLCLIGQARWLDPTSADALVFVARRLQSERIVVLFAAREGEARQFQAPDLPELRLGGLGPAGAGERLAAQVGPLAPRSATGWSPRPAATRWRLRSYPKP